MAGRKKINTKTFLYEMDAKYRRLVLEPSGDPKTHVPKLLAKLRGKKTDLVREFLEILKNQFPDDYAKEGDKLNLQNPEFIALMFEAATQIDIENRAGDRAIAMVFEKAGLNIASPMDWRVLLEMFCWAHFGEKGKPGKKVLWTEQKYCELLRDVHKTKKKLGCKEDSIALKDLMGLRKNGSLKYPYGYDRLKKALAEARNPDFNSALIKPTYEILSQELEAASMFGVMPAFDSPDAIVEWLKDRDLEQLLADDKAAQQKQEHRKKMAVARSIADRIGAGESF